MPNSRRPSNSTANYSENGSPIAINRFMSSRSPSPPDIHQSQFVNVLPRRLSYTPPSLIDKQKQSIGPSHRRVSLAVGIRPDISGSINFSSPLPSLKALKNHNISNLSNASFEVELSSCPRSPMQDVWRVQSGKDITGSITSDHNGSPLKKPKISTDPDIKSMNNTLLSTESSLGPPVIRSRRNSVMCGSCSSDIMVNVASESGTNNTLSTNGPSRPRRARHSISVAAGERLPGVHSRSKSFYGRRPSDRTTGTSSRNHLNPHDFNRF